MAASCGSMSAFAAHTDRLNGSSPSSFAMVAAWAGSASSTNARLAPVSRNARTSDTCRTTRPVQHGQPGESNLKLFGARPGRALTSPSQSARSPASRAISALLPEPGDPTTICTGTRTDGESAFFATTNRQAQCLQLPVQMGALKSSAVCHT